MPPMPPPGAPSGQPLGSYTALQTTLGDWLNRADLVAVVPAFIALAEAELSRTLRVRDMIVRGLVGLTTNWLALPPDCMELVNVHLAGKADGLKVRTDDQLDRLRGLYTAAGEPRWYRNVGAMVEVLPGPDASGYTVELEYYGVIPPLAAVQTNWLLLKHPDVYLYGALMHSAPYLKDDPRIAVWTAGYGRALASIRAADDRAALAGSTLRILGRPLP